jgi:hypothetical protein
MPVLLGSKDFHKVNFSGKATHFSRGKQMFVLRYDATVRDVIDIVLHYDVTVRDVIANGLRYDATVGDVIAIGLRYDVTHSDVITYMLHSLPARCGKKMYGVDGVTARRRG